MRSNAVALGAFDGVHIGHRAVILRALEFPGLEPCVFTFSMSGSRPESKRGAKVILSDDLKLKYIWELGVREVFSPPFDSFQNMTGEQFVDQVLLSRCRAGAVCCGYNFRFGSGASCSAEDLRGYCEARGIEFAMTGMIASDGEPVSSSRIRAAIEQGDIRTANRLCGRRYTIRQEVVHGRKLGRTLDFPTINQRLPEYCVLPKFGVYATAVWIYGTLVPGVTNVGIKPTVARDGGDGILLETFIEGFSGDLYGDNVEVEFLEYLRSEQKFPSLDALKSQIQADVRTAAEIFRQNG